MEVPGKLAKSEDKETNEDINQLCEHCQFENVTTKAAGICRECEEFMCDLCFLHHLKGKRNRQHELLDANEAKHLERGSVEDVGKCKEHDNETIKFYCRKHELVGCGDCIILGHSTCKPEYINDVAKYFLESEEFISLNRKLEQLELTSKENYEIIRKNRKDCEDLHREEIKKIRIFRTNINEYLDKAEEAIVSEANQLMADNEKLLDKLEDDCKFLTSEMENLRQRIDTKHYLDNDLFIQAVRSQRNVIELEAKMNSLISMVQVNLYEFEPDEQLCMIATSTRKLGKLKISTSSKTNSEKTAQLDRNKEATDLTKMDIREQQVRNEQKKEERQPRVVVQARV